LEDKLNKDDYNNEQITKQLLEKQEELNEIPETTITRDILRSTAIKVENNGKKTLNILQEETCRKKENLV